MPRSPVNTTNAGGTLRGVAMGGRQPIIGATVALYEAGTGGNGGLAIAASSANAATFVGSTTTLSNGSFSLLGGCNPGSQYYLLSTGGNPGGGTNNAAGLLGVLGTCPAGGNFDPMYPSGVFLNEASTVAAGYALAQYASDATHISSDNTGPALVGIRNAFNSADLLYHLGYSGNSGPGTSANDVTTSGGIVPQQELNSLANSLAACVNSTRNQACYDLFKYTNEVSTPTETATAAIRIAQNPTTDVLEIFQLANGVVPYGNHLTTQPKDWSVGIVYKLGGIVTHPLTVAIDGQGNVYTAGSTSNNVVQVTPLGVYTQLPANGLNAPVMLSIDYSNGIWVANNSSAGPRYYNGSQQAVAVSDNSGDGAASQPHVGVSSYGRFTFSVSNFTLAGNSPNKTVTEPLDNSGGIEGIEGSSIFNPFVDATALDGTGGTWLSGTAAGASSASVDYYDQQHNIHHYVSGFSQPSYMAVDRTGVMYAVDINGGGTGSNSVWELTVSGASGNQSVAHTELAGGLAAAAVSVAVNGDGNLLLSTNQPALALTPADFTYQIAVTHAYLNNQSTLAIDLSGNVWVANYNDGTLLEFVGLTSPVVQPFGLAAEPTSGMNNVASSLGTRP